MCFRYDTFEMLRENLDTVLKDLLEFKPKERITSKYPGAHLDLENNFLNLDLPSFHLLQDNEKKSEDVKNITWEDFRCHCLKNNRNNTEIVNRIRRYLNGKSKEMMAKPIVQMKKKLKRYFTKRKTFNKLRVIKTKTKNDVGTKKFVNTKDIRYGRKLQMYVETKKKRQDSEVLSIIKENLLEDLHQSNDDLTNGDAAIKARFLFKSCMNYNILQKRSHQPLLDLLDYFGGWPILKENWDSSQFDWLKLMARLRLYNNDILISQWVGPDIKNSDEFVIQFDQTSLGKH